MLPCFTSLPRCLPRLLSTPHRLSSSVSTLSSPPNPRNAGALSPRRQRLKYFALKKPDGGIVKILKPFGGNKKERSLEHKIDSGISLYKRPIDKMTRHGLVRYKMTQEETSSEWGLPIELQPHLPRGPKMVWLGGWTPTTRNLPPEQLLKLGRGQLFEFDTEWTTRFAHVSQGRSVNLELELRYGSMEPIIKKYANSLTSVQTMHWLWSRRLFNDKINRHKEARSVILWQDVMLWCLHNDPSRALLLLRATFIGHNFRPPRYVALDCLHHLANHFLENTTDLDTSSIKAIYNLTLKVVEGGDKDARAQPVPDRILSLLLKHLDHEKAMHLLNVLINNNAHMHANTILHFLDLCLNLANVSLAMRLINIVVQSGMDTQKSQVQMACVRLVRAQFDVENNYRIRTHLFTEILGMGIKPELPLFNAVLLNSIDAGDLHLAFQMYDLIGENNLEPDYITYGILLKGAVARGDGHIRDRLMEEIKSKITKPVHPHLVSSLLHAVFNQQLDLEQPPFLEMLNFYTEHCDLRPLQELGLCSPNAQSPPSASQKPEEEEERWPTTIILGQMVCAYIHTHGLNSPSSVENLYTRYHNFVTQNHPLIRPLAQTDHVANAFIFAFGAHAPTLPKCTTIIKDMLDFSSQPTFNPYLSLTESRLSGPTTLTWSFLVSVYFKHNQPLAAEKVLTLMRERGLEPDRVTWNSIVKGYAGMQDVERAVDAMKRMDAAGFEADELTLKVLKRISNKRRLVQLLGRRLQVVEEEGKVAEWEEGERQRRVELDASGEFFSELQSQEEEKERAREQARKEWEEKWETERERERSEWERLKLERKTEERKKGGVWLERETKWRKEVGWGS